MTSSTHTVLGLHVSPKLTHQSESLHVRCPGTLIIPVCACQMSMQMSRHGSRHGCMPDIQTWFFNLQQFFENFGYWKLCKNFSFSNFLGEKSFFGKPRQPFLKTFYGASFGAFIFILLKISAFGDISNNYQFLTKNDMTLGHLLI